MMHLNAYGSSLGASLLYNIYIYIYPPIHPCHPSYRDVLGEIYGPKKKAVSNGEPATLEVPGRSVQGIVLF